MLTSALNAPSARDRFERTNVLLNLAPIASAKDREAIRESLILDRGNKQSACDLAMASVTRNAKRSRQFEGKGSGVRFGDQFQQFGQPLTISLASQWPSKG
jgi:FixJ family two-component response regulator